jgi:hypothetical protein
MSAAERAIRVLDFEAVASADSDARLRLSGNADARIVGEFETLVRDLHEGIVAHGTKRVAVDIRTLEFMNASCFNVLVAWVASINELRPEQRYQLHIATNPGIPWQRRSLRTLCCFATDLVVVED